MSFFLTDLFCLFMFMCGFMYFSVSLFPNVFRSFVRSLVRYVCRYFFLYLVRSFFLSRLVAYLVLSSFIY